MGLLDKIFKSGGDSAQVSPTSTLTQSQRSLLDKIAGRLGSEFGRGVTPYQGQRVADTSPLQNMGFDIAGMMNPAASSAIESGSSALGTFDPYQGQGFLDQAGDTLNNFLGDYDPSGAQDFWQQSFVNPATESFEQDIIPQIMERFAGANATDSGAMNKTLARAGRDLSTQLSGQLGNILYNDKNNFMDRQQNAVNQAGNLATMPGNLAMQNLGLSGGGLDIAGQLAGLGSMERSIDQQGLTSQMQKFAEGQGYNNPWMQYLGPALGTNAFENIVYPAEPSYFDQLAPVAAAFAGGFVGK